MNNKGFTLIELLGVIVILSIIMIIALPNIASVLETSKREAYISDAKKLVTDVEYAIRTNDIEKPGENELLKVKLSYFGTVNVKADADGNNYDLDNSYVIVVRKNGYLEYYVNLIANINSSNKGIKLINVNELSGNDRLKKVETNIDTLDNSAIKDIVEIYGTIIEH